MILRTLRRILLILSAALIVPAAPAAAIIFSGQEKPTSVQLTRQYDLPPNRQFDPFERVFDECPRHPSDQTEHMRRALCRAQVDIRCGNAINPGAFAYKLGQRYFIASAAHMNPTNRVPFSLAGCTVSLSAIGGAYILKHASENIGEPGATAAIGQAAFRPGVTSGQISTLVRSDDWIESGRWADDVVSWEVVPLTATARLELDSVSLRPVSSSPRTIRTQLCTVGWVRTARSGPHPWAGGEDGRSFLATGCQTERNGLRFGFGAPGECISSSPDGLCGNAPILPGFSGLPVVTMENGEVRVAAITYAQSLPQGRSTPLDYFEYFTRLEIFGGASTNLFQPITVVPFGLPMQISRAIRPRASRQPGESFRDCTRCPDLVVVPGGMAELPPSAAWGRPEAVRAAVSSFAMGRFEITNNDWLACVEGGGCRALENQWGGLWPVRLDNWSDAQQYVHWLSRRTGFEYRLPTLMEARWAISGGAATTWYWGDDIRDVCSYEHTAWWDPVEGRRVFCFVRPASGTWHVPVGSYRPNPFGLFDLLGNSTEALQSIDQYGQRYIVNSDANGLASPAESYLPMPAIGAGGGFRVVRVLE